MFKITSFFIENSRLAAIISLLMIYIGFISITNITAESNPAVNFATAVITTQYKGASAKDIEIKITKPIEDEISGIDGIKDIRSISQPGISIITVRLDIDKKNINISETMSDLQKAVDRTSDLPSDLISLPKFLEINSEEFPVIIIAVTGKNTKRNRDLVVDLLKEDLKDNQDIKSIKLEGYKERQFQINLDPEKMLKNNIGINEVTQKISSRNISIPSGNIKSKSSQILTRIEATVNNIEEIEKIIIRSNFTGNVIKLKDIASIKDSSKEIELLTRYNGEEATLLTVNKKSNADTIDLVNDIKKRLFFFKKRYQNQLTFHITYDESNEVKNRINILSSNAIIGFFIILLSLFVFLPAKIAFSSATSVPLVIVTTLGCMFFLDINLNNVTIMALILVLGMLVDDSVVISENFNKNYNKGLSGKDAAILAVKNLSKPITITAFTTIAAFLPMLITKGVMGEFIKWIPIVITIALILSLIESFWFLPVRLAKSKQNNINLHKEDWFHKFEIKFKKLIIFFLKKRYFILICFFIIISTSFILIVKFNKFILFPTEQVETYMGRIVTDRNNRLEKTDEIMKEISHNIKNKLNKSVSHVVTRSGISDINSSQPGYKEGNNVGYFLVYVNKNTRYSLSVPEVLKKLNTIKHIDAPVLTFEPVRNGPPVGNDIEVTFKSNNTEDINNMIEIIKNKLKTIKGISNLQTDDIIGEKEVFVKIDYNKANELNLDVSNIGNIVKTAISGTIASKVTIDNKDIELLVRFNKNARSSIKDLSKIRIMDRNGNLVPLENIVYFKSKDGSPFIKRFNNKRAKTLTGIINKEVTTPTKINNLIKDIFKENSHKFLSVSLYFGGVEESTTESINSLSNAFNISLIIIFALLVFLFKSYIKPIIIISNIPLGLFGFSVAFLLHNKPISFLAIIGLIGLSGVIINSSIILVSYIIRLEEQENNKLNLHQILAQAASARLRSVIVTSCTTIAGLFPIAYGLGGHDALLSPMTLSMMWGLTSGTILTLIWTPCIYAILYDMNHLFKKYNTSNTKSKT